MNLITHISDITTQDVAEYLRVDNTGETNTLANLLTVSKAYVEKYTGKTIAELNDCSDVVIAILILCGDMYDNRALYVDESNVNKVVWSILDLHSVNLL